MNITSSRIERRGLMLVLSSPSGAGKTTISRLLLERDDEISLSVSVTTRPKRPGEVEGQDYHFVDLTEFNLMLNRRELLEHAKVFRSLLWDTQRRRRGGIGVRKRRAFRYRLAGRTAVETVSTQRPCKCFYSAHLQLGELARRLHSRAQDPSAVVAARMAKAPDEISHWPEYDYIIVNHNIEESVAEVQAILAAERLKRERQIGITDFVKRLREWQ